MIWLSYVCDMTRSYVRDITCTWGVCCCTHTSPILSERPYDWDMTHSYVWHDPSIGVKWLRYMYDMTRSYVRDMTRSYVRDMTRRWGVHCCAHPSPIPSGRPWIWDMTHVWFVTWLIYRRNMTELYVWHGVSICDSFTCVTWLIHLRHDSFICETWLMHMWDMTRLYVWQIYFKELIFQITSQVVWDEISIIRFKVQGLGFRV